MDANHTHATDAALAVKLDGLKTRLNLLNTKRTRLETQIEAARKEFARLSAEAVAGYGTSDVAELQAKLAAIQDENLKAVTTFETALNEYDTALAQVAMQVA